MSIPYAKTMRPAIFVLFLLLSCTIAQARHPFRTIRISGDIELIRLSDKAYVHVSVTEIPPYGKVSCNGLILVSGRQAFLFDTPMTDSLTKTLVSYLERSMHLTVTGFIPNHWHGDCMGGLRYLQSIGVRSYANQLTIDLAKQHDLPLPDVGFSDSLWIPFGDMQIGCFYPGAAHSVDNIVVWIPSEKILFAGCMVKSMSSTDLGNVADGDLTAYPVTLDQVAAKFSGAKYVIPGHGAIGGTELISHTRELIE